MLADLKVGLYVPVLSVPRVGLYVPVLSVPRVGRDVQIGIDGRLRP